MDAVVRTAGLDPSVVADVDAWVSARFVSRLAREILRQVYGLREPPSRDDPAWQLWREAGREGFERESLGATSTIIRAFGGPRPFYRALPLTIRRASTVIDVEVVSCGPCQEDISFVPRNPEIYQEGYDRCAHRVGSLEAIPVIWGLPRAQIEHHECMHDLVNPASKCR